MDDTSAQITTCDLKNAYSTCVPRKVLEVLGSTAVGIVALDEHCRIIFMNSRARGMIGRAADDALGKPVTFFIEDPLLVRWLHSGARGVLPPFPWRRGAVMISAGRHGPADSPGGYVLYLQASESFAQVDERVYRLKEELSLILENSYDGVVLVDGDLIVNVNASFGRITGIAPSTLIGKTIAELDNERHICLAAVKEVIRVTRYHKKTLTLQRKLSRGNEIFLTGNPVFDRHGQIARVLVNIRDITDLKSLEDQIKKVTKFCQEAGGRKDDGREIFNGIIAESPAMMNLIDLILRVSQVDSTILLKGESGVGKDVLARLVHRLSERREKPFVSVNCSAIPETLLESEFFGYEKGAFTSASQGGKAGLFEQANGGVLFLDEIGELPLNLQVKLLTVIQDRRCRRLGGTRDVGLDFRIIAATNRDLKMMVSEGGFRMDLFYRLHVVPIEIAPLRSRREDILPLALMFLTHFNRKYNVSCTLGRELMSALESYKWQGNVRELRNLIERLVVTADSDILSVRHLPDSIAAEIGLGHPSFRIPTSLNLKEARESVERQIIKEAMARAGNTRQAAKLMGIDHSTVVRKAQRYGIDLRETTAPTPGETPAV